MTPKNETDIYRIAFPSVLRKKRGELGFTREDLAERADTSVRYIAHLEDGTRHPTLSTFCKLAYALESSPVEFMKGFQGALPEKI